MIIWSYWISRHLYEESSFPSNGMCVKEVCRILPIGFVELYHVVFAILGPHQNAKIHHSYTVWNQ